MKLHHTRAHMAITKSKGFHRESIYLRQMASSHLCSSKIHKSVINEQIRRNLPTVCGYSFRTLPLCKFILFIKIVHVKQEWTLFFFSFIAILQKLSLNTYCIYTVLWYYTRTLRYRQSIPLHELTAGSYTAGPFQIIQYHLIFHLPNVYVIPDRVTVD